MASEAPRISLDADPAYLAAHGLVPGVAVHAQYWSRDPAAPSGFHLSDAVRFEVQP